MRLQENILRIKEIMGLDNKSTSLSGGINEQDDWTSRAASGKQKCGRDARWCKNDDGTEPISSKGEKPLSGKKLKKYTETEYWVNQLLSSPTSNSDYQERMSKISSEIANVSGNLTNDQKMFIVYNLTNILNRRKEWYFRNIVKNQVKPASDTFTDKDILNFIVSKGGFDQFKRYYLDDIYGD